MQCPICGSKKTIVLGNPKELSDWLYRDHLCQEGMHVFTSRQQYWRVKVPIPNSKGTFAMPLDKLDERLIEYLMHKGPYPGRPRDMRDPQSGLFGDDA